MRLLLGKKSNPNQKNNDGGTPLLAAANGSWRRQPSCWITART